MTKIFQISSGGRISFWETIPEDLILEIKGFLQRKHGVENLTGLATQSVPVGDRVLLQLTLSGAIVARADFKKLRGLLGGWVSAGSEFVKSIRRLEINQRRYRVLGICLEGDKPIWDSYKKKYTKFPNLSNGRQHFFVSFGGFGDGG